MFCHLAMARLLIVEDTPELAALIASVARSRGHSTEICQNGAAALELAARHPPDLAIVDLLLPDVGGKEVLREFKQLGLRSIAISGVFKGEPFHQEATSELGALAFFEKPFEMKALLDAVERFVGPGGVTAPSDEDSLEELEVLSPLEEEAEEPVLVLDDEVPGPPPGEEEELEEVPTAVVEVDPSLIAATLPLPARAAPEREVEPTAAAAPSPTAEPTVAPPAARPPTKPPPAASAPERPLPLPFADREGVWSKPEKDRKKTPQRELPEWSQAGDLATTSVPRLLTAYYQASHSGELKLRQGNINKVVYFEDGQPVYAASNLASERFARFCVRKGALTEAQVGQVAERVKAQGLRSGEAMLQLGILTAQQRQVLLEDQVREIIWSTFAWTTGQYTFSPRRPARTDLVKLRVFPGNLILQGVQRTEPLVSLRKRMPPGRRLHPSPDPAYALHELELTGQQALLLAYADGSKTVEDLLTLLDLPEKEALGTLLGLELMGVLVERHDEGKRRRITYGL